MNKIVKTAESLNKTWNRLSPSKYILDFVEVVKKYQMKVKIVKTKCFETKAWIKLRKD